MKRILWVFVTILSLLGTRSYATTGDDLLGTWLNEEGTAKIQIYKEKDKYFGKIVSLKDPTYTQKDVEENDHPLVKLGAEKVDSKNPDKGLQSRPIMGLVILRDFVYDTDDQEWEDGRVYDPEEGSDYKGYLRLESPEKLYLRGYIGFSLFGRTTYWTRV